MSGFPEMGATPNHPKLDHFSIEMGYHHSRKPPYIYTFILSQMMLHDAYYELKKTLMKTQAFGPVFSTLEDLKTKPELCPQLRPEMPVINCCF